MRKSKFSEHQIIAILKAVEAGRTVRDVCREHEISDATLSSGSRSTVACKLQTSSACVNWKKKTGRLKQISADLLLENRAPKKVIAKGLKPAANSNVVPKVGAAEPTKANNLCSGVAGAF